MRNSLSVIKLLRQNMSVLQIIAYALSALTGVTILFAGYCFSQDIKPLFFSGNEGLFRKELFIVNKEVKTSIFGKGNNAFTQKEISEIESQSFVRSTAAFTQSHFKVFAWFSFGNQNTGLSTELFFEAVPDQYLDNKSEKWHWNESEKFIPIIIPRDYLNLYNFGFAGAQGLPQVSENTVQELTFNVRLSGNGLQDVFSGRIVGYTNDLNTVLVPETFLKWANARFGQADGAERVTRLIVEVKNPADKGITEFFASRPNYVTDHNKGESGKLSFFLNLLIMAVLLTGSLVLLPSIGIMLLSINLIIYKNEKMFKNLILLGYKRFSLALPYCVFVFILNFIVGGCGFALAGIIQKIYAPRLQMLGIENFNAVFLHTAIFALLCMTVISLFDCWWIWLKIRKTGRLTINN
jgi:hypothetical protein